MSERSKHSVRSIVALAALSVVAVELAQPASSRAVLADDVYSSQTQPGNALLMPFDATVGTATFLLASNLAGVSPAGSAVSTHWAFWSETCTHLVDVSICLTLNDTVVVDPTNIVALDSKNQPIGPPADLTGQRGFVTVTAYETDKSCSDGASSGYFLVDNALAGAYTIADVGAGASFGSDAIALGLDETLSFTELPDALLSPDAATGFLDIQTFDPKTLTDSRVVLLGVAENAGSGGYSAEIGPLQGVRANVGFYDNEEVNTSLPDTAFSCALFTSVRGSDTPTLIPSSVDVSSAGVVRLVAIQWRSNESASFLPVGDDDGEDGNDTWVYGFHGMAVDRFGASINGKYELVDGDSGPRPTSTGIVIPTRTPTPTSTVVAATATPIATSTPATTAATPSPARTSTPTAATPTPTALGPTATPTPTVTVTPGPGATPTLTPTASVTPAATLTPTPVQTSVPTVTPTATVAVVGCTQAKLTVSLDWTGGLASAAGAGIHYPEALLDIPGSGNAATVKARVENLTGVTSGFFDVGDINDPNAPGDASKEDLLNAGIVVVPGAVPTGNFVRITFDCRPGERAPVKGDFSCTTDIGDENGVAFSDQACAMTLQVIP